MIESVINRRLVVKKREINSLLSGMVVLIFSLYEFSYGSFGLLIPRKIWLVVIGIATISLLLYRIRFRSFSISDLLVILMILIILLWDNQNLIRGQWYYEYIFLVYFIFYLAFSHKADWHKTGIVLMVILGCVHAFWTWISFFDFNFYKNVIYPIVSPYSSYNLIDQYNQGIMAGFTTFYSINGMFLSTGICAAIGYFFFSGENRRRSNLLNWFICLFLISALLLTGKRGPILWVALSIIITFLVYQSNKPVSRFFQLFALGCLVIIGVYIGSLFVPQLLNFIIRFKNQIARGDITTNRWQLWQLAFTAFKNNPIFGNGWNWFKYNNPFGVTYHTHNTYLQWLCEIGIIGSIPFFTFMFIQCRHAIILIQKIRQRKISVDRNILGILSSVLLYELFFIGFNFTGTGFYEIQCFGPYIICCAIVEYYWVRLNGNYNTRWIWSLPNK